MKKNNRGAVDPFTWAVIGLIALGGVAYVKVFEPGRNKKVADQIAAATAEATQQAVEAKKLAAEAKAASVAAAQAHAKEIALRDQMDQNAASFSGQAKAMLEADPHPSPYTLIAIGLCESIQQSLAIKFTPEQQAAFVSRVTPLLQKNAETEKALAEEKARAAALAAGKDAEHARAVAADALAQTLTGQLAVQTAAVATTTAESATLAAKNQAWANNVSTLWQRFQAAILGIFVLLVLLGIGWWKLRGTTRVLYDAAALAEDAQNAATRGVAMTKDEIEQWWENDRPGRAAYQKVLANLRR